MLRRSVPLLLVLAACLALPAAASANAYSQVDQAFNQSGTATIPPCEFSAATLNAALKESSTYQYQYGADLTDAIQAALQARGDGACSKSKKIKGSLGASATLRGSGTGGALPGSATSATSGGLPFVLVLAFSLAAAALIVLAGWVGMTALGYDPRVGRAARHSLREAEHRLGAGWEDLADRLRRQ